jgi:hypothetical protein
MKHRIATSTQAARIRSLTRTGEFQFGSLGILDAIDGMIDRLELIQRRAESCRKLGETATSQG